MELENPPSFKYNIFLKIMYCVCSPACDCESVCVCVQTSVHYTREKDVRADPPNGWSDLHVFRMLLCSHFLGSSTPFAPLSPQTVN